MEFIPIKTRILQPPQDDLLAVLDESLTEILEQDIILISSKVVAINEGRAVPILGTNKQELIKQEADLIIERPYWNSPLTVIHNTFLGAAGIDESNANNHYILLPQDPFLSAQGIYEYLKQRFSLNKFGVIITDSRSLPFRYGATGVALGFWGIRPLINHIGQKDLFDREIQVERSNLIDGLAAGANVVMGEVAESTPVVIARGVPQVTFAEGNFKADLFTTYKDDTFRVLYEDFLD